MADGPANQIDVTRSSPQREVETLKVSSRSNPNSVAGALAGVLRTDGSVRVQVVGAGALNQAVKAIAIARTYVADGGIDVVCIPSFAEIDIDGESRTAICLDVHDQSGTDPRHDDPLTLPATAALAEEALAAGLGSLDAPS
jgi:stage V sporulation protein S